MVYFHFLSTSWSFVFEDDVSTRIALVFVRSIAVVLDLTKPGQSWSKRRVQKQEVCSCWRRGNCDLTTQQERYVQFGHAHEFPWFCQIRRYQRTYHWKWLPNCICFHSQCIISEELQSNWVDSLQADIYGDSLFYRFWHYWYTQPSGKVGTSKSYKAQNQFVQSRHCHFYDTASGQYSYV